MQGQCLCGAVRLSSGEHKEIGVCHCGYCRRWGGGPLLALHCGPDLQLEGRDFIKEYASSDWAKRAFCQECGSHLYYQLLQSGDYFVPAGLFEQSDFVLGSQIYIDKKPPYYDFANQTTTLTEQQVVAMYSAPPADAE